MSQEIEFRSHVSRKQRVALEGLVFFNSCQGRVAACIADAVAMFGAPEIVPEDPDRLRLCISGMPDAQCVFAVNKDSGKPVGVAIYIRPDLEHVTVLHLSIAAEYASGGLFSDAHLLLRLLREVKRSTRRVQGVRRLELYYGRSRAPRWRSADSALASELAS
jgi:hypothetical protein